MINIKKMLNLEYYTSEADLFLEGYRKDHPRPSHSQHLEIDKYARVFKLRDHAEAPVETEKFWDKF